MKTMFRCESCGKSASEDYEHRCGDAFEVHPLTPFQVIEVEDIPDGESGDIKIERNTLAEKTNVGGNWHNPSFMGAGETIVMLRKRGKLWMSNTPDEVGSQRFRITHSSGERTKILIGGLGLGIAIQFVHEMCVPEKVVVVEIDPDIISLVAPTYASIPWLEIVEGDIREYGKVGPKGFFDVAWIDIWGNYCTDDLDDMFNVRRSLRRVMKPGSLCSWSKKISRVQIWKEEELRDHRRSYR